MSTPTASDTELAARWLAFLLAAAAAVVLVALALLPVPASVDRDASVVVAGCLLALGTLIWTLRRRMPARAIPLLFLPIAALVVSILLESWGASAGDLGMLYVWLVLYAAYFLSSAQAGAQLALVAICFGAVLARVDVGSEAFTRWGLTVGTLAVTMFVTQSLVRRLRFEVLAQQRTARERERLMGVLETAALTDALTGLPNRRAYDSQLERELARAARQRTPVCVAMLDLDHFKRFNDTHGHAGGDRLLREAGARWSAELRGSDLLARHGGDEFTLLLPDCDEPAGLTLVERLRAATPPGQTVSTGLATWDGEEPAAALLARADAALYEAKAAGRDRARLAVAPQPA
jgi:diguanylate cyclase (GGDEF)-like protein